MKGELHTWDIFLGVQRPILALRSSCSSESVISWHVYISFNEEIQWSEIILGYGIFLEVGYVNMTNLNYKIRVQDDYKILDMWSRWSRDGGSVNKMYMRCNISDWDVPKIQDLLTRWFWDSGNVIGMILRCKIINKMTLRCRIY